MNSDGRQRHILPSPPIEAVCALWIACLAMLFDGGVWRLSWAAEPILVRASEITESSGLAVSQLQPEIFWTHNDSGDSARIFAIDRGGNVTGVASLAEVQANDFEDMASYRDGGRPRLLVADVGDNRASRDHVRIYLFDEPDPRGRSVVKQFQTLRLRYPDGPRDCEAVAVDLENRKIVFVTKSFLPLARVYQSRLPAVDEPTDAEGEVGVLDYLGTVPIPLVTAMDVDPQRGTIVLVNYFQAFRFPHVPGWHRALPESYGLPNLRQIEAVAFDSEGEVWVTSEGTPMPLMRVDLMGSGGEPR